MAYREKSRFTLAYRRLEALKNGRFFIVNAQILRWEASV